MPKVSVIVPVYNVEAYLDQCVKSILSQTLQDIEVLLINDASTDRSLELARAYETDPRVNVLDKPHSGLGYTRNYGVEHATGEYLSFVDSDDWIDADALEKLYDAASTQKADLVVFNYVRENLIDGESRVCTLPLNDGVSNEEANERMLAELIGPDAAGGAWRGVEMLGCAWRRLYRREWFMQNRLSYYNEQEIMLEDLPVSIQAHVLARRVLFLDGAYYHYRYNPVSLSTRYRPSKMEMMTECFHVVDAFLKKQGLYDAYRERHLAWLLRSAAHSALVNCFSPHNPAAAKQRRAEVRGILETPLLQEASASDYLAGGSRADRLVLRVIRTGSPAVVDLFYRFYSRMLFRNARKK